MPWYVEPFACGFQKKIIVHDWHQACRLADARAREHHTQWAVFGFDHELDYVSEDFTPGPNRAPIVKVGLTP